MLPIGQALTGWLEPKIDLRKSINDCPYFPRANIQGLWPGTGVWVVQCTLFDYLTGSAFGETGTPHLTLRVRSSLNYYNQAIFSGGNDIAVALDQAAKTIQ